MCKLKVFVISGEAQHGKDTSALMMKEELVLSGVPEERILITHYGDLLKYICKSFFFWDGVKDEQGRTLLQQVGTEIFRSKDTNYWTGFLTKIMGIIGDRFDYVLIPDTRFENEVTCWYRDGYSVTHIKVIRDGFQSGLTEEQRNHPSENALNRMTPDICIHNDGTLEDLKGKIHIVMEDILNGR